MPVIPVDTNLPAASAARRMAKEWVMLRAPTCMLPPRVAKTKATAVMHDALAPTPRHQCVDVASFAAASFASTATNSARNLISTGAVSVNSSSSSDSDNLKMNGGEGAAVSRKSTGLTDFTDFLHASLAFSDGDGNDVDAYMPTDSEASKYSFLDHLKHCMEWMLISAENRKAVELVIMIEGGTTVREMDPMKKETKEKAFLNSYVSIIQEIPDKHFDQAALCPAMLVAYKGARKKILEGGTLWRK
jgi:hypothetical protein